jgi:hypothetical protein
MSAPAKKSWHAITFPNGNTIVEQNDLRLPHFCVWGPGGTTRSDAARNQQRLAESLRDHLNGGDPPPWLADVERTSETRADGCDGTSIEATGPMVDADPPNEQWEEDGSEHAERARIALMERLMPSGGLD